MILKELMIWLPHAILTVTAVRDFGMLKNFGLATIQTYLIRISQFWSCPCLAMACIQTFPCSLCTVCLYQFFKAKGHNMTQRMDFRIQKQGGLQPRHLQNCFRGKENGTP